MLAGGACARGRHHGQHAQTEGQRGHENGAQTDAAGFHGGVDEGSAFRLKVSCEFHDQNGVFRRETHDGQNTDLEVHVVGQILEVGAEHGAQDAERYDEQHGERDGPAFVQGSQGKEHDEHGERVQHGGLGTGHLFLIGEARPFHAEVLAEFFHLIFHDVHGNARSHAGNGFALIFEGGHGVVALQHGGTEGPVRGVHGVEGHHLPGRIAEVDAVEVFGILAHFGVALHVHLLHALVVHEVVDVGAAEHGGHVGVHAGEREAHAGGLGVVQMDVELRDVVHAGGADVGDLRVGEGRAHELLAGLHQLFVAHAASVLQFHGEAVGHAEGDDGRGNGGDELAVEDARELLTDAGGHGSGVLTGLGTLGVVLELHEAHAGVFGYAAHAEAGHEHVRFHVFLLFIENEVGYLLELSRGLGQRGIRGHLQHGDDGALVFRGKEGGGQLLVHEAETAHESGVDDHESAAALHEGMHAAGVAVLVLVEPAEEAVLSALRVGFEQACAERGRKNEGHEHRQRHGGHDGHGELPVDHACGAAHEGHGQEHGGEHHADADQRGADFVHGFFRGGHGIEMFFLNHAFHVFHDHDGVVHEQTDGKNHGEQRKGVDAVAEGEQHAHGAQKNDGHGDGGNDGGPEALQEQPHDEEHQNDGFHEGFHHFMDGGEHGGRGVEGQLVGHAVREVVGEFLDLGLHQIGGFETVGAGGEGDAYARGGMTVVVGGDAVEFRAHGHAGHVADEHALTVLRHLEQHVLEFGGVAQEALSLDDDVEGLVVLAADDVGAELTGGNFHVLGRDGAAHVGRRELVLGELVGIEPDAHDVLAAEHLHRAHALRTADFILDVGADVVGEVDVFLTVVRRVQGDDHEHVVVALGHRHAVALHGGRQLRLHLLHLVLHLHVGHVGIGAHLEGEGDGGHAGGVGRRLHVDQVVDAGHVLFDDLRDGLVHGGGGSARVTRVDEYGRRGHFRVLRYGHGEDGQHTEKHGDDGQHPCEYGVMDEKAGKHYLLPPAASSAFICSSETTCTGCPPRALWTPLSMISSPSLRPSVTYQSLPMAWLMEMLRRSAMPSLTT